MSNYIILNRVFIIYSMHLFTYLLLKCKPQEDRDTSFSLRYPENLEHCIAYNRYLINIDDMNDCRCQKRGGFSGT